MLATYPPTRCGIATFTRNLATALSATGVTVDVIAIGGDDGRPRPVLATLEPGAPTFCADAARLLDAADVAIVHHEFGIYGGECGDDVLGVARRLTVPWILVCHTVPRRPNRHERWILRTAAAAASRVVVVSSGGRTRLIETYGVDRDKVSVISHGAFVRPSPAEFRPDERPLLLTWGLIARGKGIELMIDAMAALDDLRPKPFYVVAGMPHPGLGAKGPSYVESLQATVRSRGLEGSIGFELGYLAEATLATLIRRAAIIVLPYHWTDQASSGVLVEAIAAGRPVVATAFTHAADLLADGPGILVPPGDARALAQALRRVLTEPGLAASLSAAARSRAASLDWSVVAADYSQLVSRMISERSGSP